MGLILVMPLFVADRADAAERWKDLVETIFQNYGREQGIPHPVPVSLAQDGDGFIWIGTQGGLARWDGYRFRAYQPDPKDPGAVPDSYIQTLHTDPRGRLWVGTSAAGLVRYDPEHDRFIRVDMGAAGNVRTHIGAIADDGTGGLWIGTDDGLSHLTNDTGPSINLRHDAADPGSLPDGQVQTVLPDREGRLWVGTQKGLARRDEGSDRFVPIALPISADALVGVTALFEDDDGRIWIGTNRHGIYLLERGIDAPYALSDDDPASDMRDDWISSIVAESPREIWFGTRTNGIITVDPVTKIARRIRHDRTLPGSLAHDDVWALLRDSAGSIWAGGTGGLSYHSNGLGAVSTIFGATDRPNGVTNADIYTLLGTRDGRVWLGFIGGGIDIIDPTAGRVAQLRPDSSKPATALPKDIVLSMVETAGGDVFVGTFRGLYRVDGKTHQVALTTVAPGRDLHDSVSTLLIDDGILWVGGVTDGLWGIRLEDHAVVFGPTESTLLNDTEIDTLTRGRGTDLWIGGRNGVNRFDLATRKNESILPDPADPKALPAGFISSTLLDHQGRLWVSTFGGGIAVMTGRDAAGKPVFHRLGLAEGLPHVNVDKLLPDTDGRVWASTDDGLAVIDPKSFAIRALRHAEGSALLDYFDSAGTVDAAGEPLFGAKGGLSVVRGDLLTDWTFKPPVVVSDIRLGGHPVPPGRFNRAGSKQPLVLTPEANSLAVEFSALDFSAPERNRYAYKLEGFDPDWVPTEPSRRLAAYTNLPPGNYTLRLRGSNRDGVWAERDLDIPIHVVAAWYQTVWFMIAVALAGLALIAAVVRSRTAYLHARQAELERQIAERTADLRAANERLFELATIDPLTGCVNRRHFVERANDLIALSRRLESPLSLAIMDLDDFKLVNDTYGHPAGDEVLRMIGRASKAQIRATDLLGRIGGEEFALLMPNTAIDGANQFAERLREAIAGEAADVEGTILHITVSLGLAELRPNESYDQLYARADAALYAAKEAGRNRVIVDADAIS